MATEFDDVIVAVKKILGDKTQVPKPSSGYTKAQKQLDDAWAKFDKTRKTLEDQILDVQKAVSSVGLALKQYGEQIEKSDLGCDTKDSAFKTKRAAAQKQFDTFFDEIASNTKINIRNADELDKHLMNLASYKSPEAADI